MNIQLIYHSIARPGLKESEIHDILNTSREFYEAHNITGCLLYYHDEFLQILEGDTAVIHDRMQELRLDTRHSHVTVLYGQESDVRFFKKWDMIYHIVSDTSVESMIEHKNMLHHPIDNPSNFTNTCLRLYCAIADSILKYSFSESSQPKDITREKLA